MNNVFNLYKKYIFSEKPLFKVPCLLQHFMIKKKPEDIYKVVIQP